ncbi:MAG: hypothetical protein M1839_008702 [Geoglossum umbratile]|nr:MAG: hypothetical protein M1839_008702 [Geoglossum umbratile]
MTDVYEGSLIRMFRQLEELLRQIAQAAKVMGSEELEQNFETALNKVTLMQWIVDYYPQGKTSVQSRFNIPGKIGWATMEAPGFLLLLYVMFELPRQNGLRSSLPWMNWAMAGLFCIHYINRAIISPLYLNPSMSPIHLLVWASAVLFQIVNSISISGWLAGYGPTIEGDWEGRAIYITLGVAVWISGFVGNIYFDDKLREIRRAAARDQKRRDEAQGYSKLGSKTVDKVYMLPQGGLFDLILYPHFLCEWIEWAGYWIIGGWMCVPARSFLLNEISTMLPRALQGRRWYVQRFGKDKVGQRKAVIPGLL